MNGADALIATLEEMAPVSVVGSAGGASPGCRTGTGLPEHTTSGTACALMSWRTRTASDRPSMPLICRSVTMACTPPARHKARASAPLWHSSTA